MLCHFKSDQNEIRQECFSTKSIDYRCQIFDLFSHCKMAAMTSFLADNWCQLATESENIASTGARQFLICSTAC